MKIPQKLVQFKNKETLLVVMGHHHGLFFKARDGEIEKIEEIKIEEPEYSDKEGLFKKGGGEDTTYGSVLESKKNEYEKKFSIELAEKVLAYSKKVSLDQIYLFYPKEMNYLIEKDWNENLKKIISARFYGNYTKQNPKVLLEMITEKIESLNKTEPIGEAKKILDK
ncbi:MAG: hypothetical protein ACOCU8_01265 [Patescibacteria group bacterium]